MIAVDTSALMAIALGEPQGRACAAVLETNDRLLISAGTLAEALIVAGRRDVSERVNELIDELGFEIISVTPDSARRIGQAYQRWGKSRHPAAMNFGDCFAYDVATQNRCRLLFVGEDFARTDVQSALSSKPGNLDAQ